MAGQTRPTMSSRPTGAMSPVGLDRARKLAWWDVLRTDINQKVAPSADPTHSHWIHKLDLGNQFRLLFGRIVDEIAYTNSYKVQLESGVAPMWCTFISQTALQPIGSRQLGQIALGASVIVAIHPTDTHGIILGVIPDPQTNSQSTMVDFISQAARCGLLVDEAHNYFINQPFSSLITDWSAGRPLDATTEGESGRITETGLLDFIDSFMTIKRTDEETGIFTFYNDQLARLTGHNLQIWSAGSEREDVDDEGEIDIVQGWTPYYWEALGAYDLNANTCKEIDAGCWQKDEDYQSYAANEPCDDRQAPFYRLRDFHGYLGQAYKKVLCLPPIESCGVQTIDELDGPQGAQDCTEAICDNTLLNLLPAENIFPGVFEESLALSGRYTIRSAHEIVLSKHILIPVPKQIILPQDPSGDNASNYSAAGALGAGPAHLVQGSIDQPVSDDDPSQIKAAGFMDTHAFVFNWVGEHPFHYHTADWYLPEENELNYLGESCSTPAFPPPFFDNLACHYLLEAPAAIPLLVDHRYGDVSYYPNSSNFVMLDNGGIIINDGFGAEIKMVNGHIYITAPGDIILQSGRDVISMAGFDFIAKAKNSWDISATNKDGRLQANNNLWLCASGESGGILIQSNATSTISDFEGTGEDAVLGGIVIKSNNSLVSICANDIALNLTNTDEEHTIMFDAGWNGKVRFKSKFFERFLATDGAGLDWWVDPDNCNGEVQKGVEWWQDGVIICSPVVINDKLLVSDCGIFKNTIAVTNGHIVTSEAKSVNGQVGTLTDESIASYEENFIYFDDKCTDSTALGDDELNKLCNQQGIFNVCNASFSFRSVEQYRTLEFVMFESKWQQMARLGSIATNIWEELGVDDTYPYPGKEILLGETYRTLDLNLYDINTGLAVDRGIEYEIPMFNAPAQLVLNTNYTVII